MVKIKCSFCKLEKERIDFDENEIIKDDIDYEEKWGYCKSCLSNSNLSIYSCDCCGSRNHVNYDNSPKKCEDSFVEILHELNWLISKGQIQTEDENALKFLTDLGFMRRCKHFNEHLVPLLEDSYFKEGQRSEVLISQPIREVSFSGFDSFASFNTNISNSNDESVAVFNAVSEIQERRQEENRATESRLQDALKEFDVDEYKNLQEQPPKNK